MDPPQMHKTLFLLRVGRQVLQGKINAVLHGKVTAPPGESIYRKMFHGDVKRLDTLRVPFMGIVESFPVCGNHEKIGSVYSDKLPDIPEQGIHNFVVFLDGKIDKPCSNIMDKGFETEKSFNLPPSLAKISQKFPPSRPQAHPA
jgi:hypothetical protein